jgi:dipeptidyl aminopeptidase/acylaminoacyl peptidase
VEAGLEKYPYSRFLNARRCYAPSSSPDGTRLAFIADLSGALEEHRELLVEISPMTHLHRVIAPLLVAHGEQDIRVPITETEQVVAALRARGVPIEFIRLPHAGHGIVRLEDKLLVYPAIAEFLARHLEVTR